MTNIKITLDPKLKKMFTACMAPIPTCNGMVNPDYERSNGKHRRSKSKSKNAHRERQQEALKKMEGKVKKQVAAAYTRRCDSLITKDDATLLTEVDLMHRTQESSETETDYSGSDSSGTYSSASETRDLNTIGEDENRFKSSSRQLPAPLNSEHILDTNNNATNGNVISPTSSTGGVKSHPRSTINKSLRSKFDYYRVNQQFSAPGYDPPCDKTMHSFKSLKAEDAAKMASWNLHQRRNQLAKQILVRRQKTPKASRTGFDP